MDNEEAITAYTEHIARGEWRLAERLRKAHADAIEPYIDKLRETHQEEETDE